jgi:hypothetical protein
VSGRLFPTGESILKTVAIILRVRGKYHFKQESTARHRSDGVVIADCEIDDAAGLIASQRADLYVPGMARRSVEHLDPTHPLSFAQQCLRRQAEQAFLIRCASAAQQPPN